MIRSRYQRIAGAIVDGLINLLQFPLSLLTGIGYLLLRVNAMRRKPRDAESSH